MQKKEITYPVIDIKRTGMKIERLMKEKKHIGKTAAGVFETGLCSKYIPLV